MKLRDFTVRQIVGDDAVALGLHEMAMSKVPQVALAGRCLKDLNGALDGWFRRELERAPLTGQVLAEATPTIALNVATLLLGRIARGDNPTMVFLLDQVGSALGQAAAQAAVDLRTKARSP